MKTEYRVTSDPGHGWLHVKRAELERLGLIHQISRYSYQRGETVYLEEDRDAGLFLAAKEARGEAVRPRVRYVERTAIRSYQPFTILRGGY
jgi:hypothetical protein